MGMANSDDEELIMKQHSLMEKIREIHPTYHVDTHGMNEDMKIIYDHSLVEQYRQIGNPVQYKEPPPRYEQPYSPPSPVIKKSDFERRIEVLKKEKGYFQFSDRYQDVMELLAGHMICSKQILEMIKMMKSSSPHFPFNKEDKITQDQKMYDIFLDDLYAIFKKNKCDINKCLDGLLKSSDINLVRFGASLDYRLRLK